MKMHPAMADARAREQLRQEREAFDRACRHGEAWFTLRLALGYVGLAIMPAMLGVAVWVLLHPTTYGALPIGAAAVTVTTQTLGLGFTIVRLVLLQPQVAGLEPATVVNHAPSRSRRKSRRAGTAGATSNTSISSEF